MTLRRKILIGYLIFIAIFVAANAWSAYRLHVMADVSRRIIDDNYDSVVAAQEMKERLERQDSAAAFLLLGRSEKALPQIRDNRVQFDAALARARANVTEPAEPEVLAALVRERDEYYRLADAFTSRVINAGPTANPTSEAAARAEYFSTLEPAFHRLRAKCQELLELNQTAMRAKSQAAEKVARTWYYSTVLADILLLVVAVWLAFVWSRVLVRPLQQLRATTKRIAGGDLDARVPLYSHDEVGMLGAEFNRMAERIRQLRRSDLGQVMLAQQTTEAAIDSLSDPVVVTDASGLVTKLNHAAEAIFGKEGDNLGKSVDEMAKDPRFGVAVADTLNSERPVDLGGAAAVWLTGEDGNAEHAFHLRATPMRNEDGHLLGTVTLLEDITQARARDQARTEFIDSASEHLRGPLTNVELGLHLLLEGGGGELTDQQSEVLQASREDCVRVERLLHDLVELSHLESGEQPPQVHSFDPVQWLAEIGERIRTRTESKRISLVLSAPSNLPLIYADPSQLDRALDQLTNNAIRHTPAGGEIGLLARSIEGEIVIEVSNTGPGIPRDYLDRVFDRFVQVPGATAGTSGLGLTIARRLIEQNSGRISVSSAPGKGTTFTLTLPADEVNGG